MLELCPPRIIACTSVAPVSCLTGSASNHDLNSSPARHVLDFSTYLHGMPYIIVTSRHDGIGDAPTTFHRVPTTACREIHDLPFWTAAIVSLIKTKL
jgi:hypothetical protein